MVTCPPNKQTVACENITFLHLRWQTVINTSHNISVVTMIAFEIIQDLNPFYVCFIFPFIQGRRVKQKLQNRTISLSIVRPFCQIHLHLSQQTAHGHFIRS